MKFKTLVTLGKHFDFFNRLGKQFKRFITRKQTDIGPDIRAEVDRRSDLEKGEIQPVEDFPKHFQDLPLIAFGYFNPKTKDRMEVWDRFPLGIFVAEERGLWRFVNIHWLAIDKAYAVLNLIQSYRDSKSSLFKQRAINAIVAVAKQTRGASYAFRLYDPRLISGWKVVPSDRLREALTIYAPDFKPGGKKRRV